MRVKQKSALGLVKDAAFYKRRRTELDALSTELQKRKGLLDFRAMQPGPARREVLVAWLREGLASGERRVVYVNRRWCLQLHQDRDLQVLLKKGVLQKGRDNQGFSPSLGSRSGSFSTYLKLADKNS